MGVSRSCTSIFAAFCACIGAFFISLMSAEKESAYPVQEKALNRRIHESTHVLHGCFVVAQRVGFEPT